MIHIEKYPHESVATSRTLHHHSAQVRLRVLADGVVDVAYFGVIGRLTLESLHTQVMAVTLGVGAMVIQLDRALMIGPGGPLAAQQYAGNDSSACLIVPDDLVGIWTEQASAMAAQGLIRLVFARSQASLAYMLAGDLAAARQGWPASKSDSPATSSVSFLADGQTSDPRFRPLATAERRA